LWELFVELGGAGEKVTRHIFNKPIWQTMIQRIRLKTLAHALLLTGPQGLGKLDLALDFAQFILCEQQAQNEQACGHCRACLLFIAGSHPDFLCIQPEAEAKVIKVDQIRHIVSVLEKTAQMGPYQIVIIEPAEQMNMAAANALLKTLEEPQGQVLIMLVTPQSANLPATIRSRCQTVLFKPPTLEEARRYLQSQVSSPPEEEEVLLRLVEHAPLRAHALVQSRQIEQCYTLLEHLWELSTGKMNAVQVANLYQTQDPKLTMQALFAIIADLIRLKALATISEPFLVFVNKKNVLERLAKKISSISLFQYYDYVLQTQQLLSKHSSINLQLQLEDLFIQWSKQTC
jgi:DNA polymerase-3 subunit delta'